jgi:hypothetical protein
LAPRAKCRFYNKSTPFYIKSMSFLYHFTKQIRDLLALEAGNDLISERS